MNFYNIIRNNFTPVANTEDVFTVMGASNRSWMIVEIDITGAGGPTAAFTEFAIYRVGTVGVTSSNTVTIVRANNANQPAAAMTCVRTWSTIPVVSDLVHPCPVNSNGFRHYWRAKTDLSDAIEFQGGGTSVAAAHASVRALTVNGNSTVRIKVAEI